jgi:hypothetical protein
MKILKHECLNGLQVQVEFWEDGRGYTTSLCPKGSRHNYGVATKRSSAFDEAWKKEDIFMFVAAGLYNLLSNMAPSEVRAKQDAAEKQGVPAGHGCDA